MGIYIKQSRKKDKDSGYRRFVVTDGKGFISDTADVVDIEIDKMGHSIKLEVLDSGLIHFWSHSFDLELVRPFHSTAIIQLKQKGE